MADIASILKAEIVRLSRKTIRQWVAPLHRASTTHRRDIAALKKQVATLERQLASLGKMRGNQAAASEESGTASPRFSAKGLRTHRARLGLSQEEFGKLVGVSAQSVYNWERESSRPRHAQIAAIAAVRTLGKREVQRRLAESA